MNITDSTVLGYNKVISDWVALDSRQFVRDVTSVLDVGDSPVAAVLTIKASPADTDANAIIQLTVISILGPNGQIVGNVLTINVQPAGMGPVNVGSVYDYDIVIFTANNFRYTVETGQIIFLQNTGQEQIGSQPGFLPNNGIPVFRGFASAPPGSPGGPLNVIANLGDYFMNSVPAVGQPAGWMCSVGGSPGTWVRMANLL